MVCSDFNRVCSVWNVPCAVGDFGRGVEILNSVLPLLELSEQFFFKTFSLLIKLLPGCFCSTDKNMHFIYLPLIIIAGISLGAVFRRL